MRNPDSEPVFCRKVGECRGEGGGALSACPSKWSERESVLNKNPLSLAEDLCIDALLSHARTRRKDEYWDMCSDVEYPLEVALSHPDKRDRSSYFYQHKQRLSEVLSWDGTYSGGRYQEYVRMQVLHKFTPAFEARVEERTLSKQDMQAVHLNLCNWLNDFNENVLAGIPEENIRNQKDLQLQKTFLEHFATEVEAMALLSRLNEPELFPWPALSREEANHARVKNNHDFYIMPKDESGNYIKLPVQVKNNKRSSGYRGVAMVTHRSILMPARDKRAEEREEYLALSDNTDDGVYVSQSSIDRLSATPTIRQLLVAESQLGPSRMDPDHKNLLELASSTIVSRILRSQYSETA